MSKSARDLMRMGPWPKTGEGETLWFTDKGYGPSEVRWAVYAAISVKGSESVGLNLEGLGGPYMDPETADAMADALKAAASECRRLKGEGDG